MVLSQWSLADTCMCHACPFFSTCDRYELDCCTNAPSIGKTGKLLNQPKCLHSSVAKNVQCSAHSCPEPEQAIRFLIETGFLEAVTQQHQQLKLFPRQGLRFLPDSSFLSFQHCGGDTLYWSDPLQWLKLGREWFSQWSLLDTCMCARCSVLVMDMNWIAARSTHQLVRLARFQTSPSAYIPARQN